MDFSVKTHQRVATFTLKPVDKRTFSARGDGAWRMPKQAHECNDREVNASLLKQGSFRRLPFPCPCSVFFVDQVNLSFHFFGAVVGVPEEDEVTEEGGAVATWTVVPVVRESDGLTITLSDSVTPLRISD